MSPFSHIINWVKQWKRSDYFLWAMLALIGIFILHFVINFKSGAYLTGWDALNPEFNYDLNLRRALTAVWQENYGTGTVGGHGFAATLPHTLATLALDVVLPSTAVRQVFTLLMLYTGVLGVFVVVTTLLDSLNVQKGKLTSLFPLLAALFYLLNWGTAQIFYLPLEAFTVHFATLPWLFLTYIHFLNKPRPTTVGWFFLIALLSSVQGFVPSVFISVCLSLAIFSLGFLFENGFQLLKNTKNFRSFLASRLKIVSVGGIAFLLGNSYWHYPYGY